MRRKRPARRQERKQPARRREPPTPAAPEGRPLPETALLGAIRVGIALVLLTPLVITPQTAFPFVVGKAVWSRSLIGIVFALWVLLALWRPAWRPPRSWLLWLLAADLGVVLLAGIFGVSFNRSLWSTYERMHGIVDLAHWFAFTVVVASVAREGRELRRLLHLQVGVGLAVALIGLGILYGVEWPVIGPIPERSFPRIGGTLGNPTYLGAYLVVNALLAIGLLARLFTPEPERAAAPSRRPPAAGRRRRAAPGLTATLFLGASAFFSLLGVVLSVSLGALAGLVAGAGFLLVLAAPRFRGAKARRALLATVGAAGLFVLAVAMPGTSGRPFSGPLVDRLLAPGAGGALPSLESRFAAWGAGLRGLRERPALGFGGENYIVPYRLHASEAQADRDEPHDRAHNVLVEAATTGGVLGLLVHLAVWGFALRTLGRGARSLEGPRRVLALFAGSALVALFVAMQAIFATASLHVLFALLFAVVVFLETPAEAPGPPARLGRGLSALLRRRWVRVGAGAGVLALAGAGLAANRAIHAAATEINRGLVVTELATIESAIRSFEPLANLPRRLMFEYLAQNWNALSGRRRGEGRRLLARADAEARRALVREPRSWEVHSSLARLYYQAAATHPQYAERARRHLDTARELSPNHDPYQPSFVFSTP